MFALLLLAPLLAGQTVALEPLSPIKRHHDTSPGCPDNWLQCGDSGLCYNPDEGETCCPGGTYACPSLSFCLSDPYCCPNNLDAKSCAREYGLSLTTSVPPPPHQSSGPSDSSSDSEGITIDPIHSYPEPTTMSSSAGSITVSSTPIPTHASSLASWPSMSIGPSTTSLEEDPEYTGGAAASRSLDLGVVVGVLGYWGLMLT
ncbi:hypothetical protein BJX99DRAFT_255946 [Aspergillus californicus]